MDMNFGIRISAKDDSGGVLKDAMSGFKRFASVVSKPITIPLKVGQTGLGILRDINLGLRPIISGLDNIIERGSGLEVVSKSFRSLTGLGEQGATRLARRLVDASAGTLRLSRAMEIANRAMASGMNLEQIGTAIEFVSKKAATTGKDAEAAIDTVITGLSRGSTLFLDDFGVLVDGLDAVKRTYDSINGSGAWDALGPAAQKAETIRQAISEMRGQMERLGVSGEESVFVWQSLKNAIGDASDNLLMAVGRSNALRDALTGARQVFGGLASHFEKGGSFGDVLFGKDGGKSGGLFGFLKAGALDLGTFIGKGAGVVGYGLLAEGGELLARGIDALDGKIQLWFNTIRDAIAEGFWVGVGYIREAMIEAWGWVQSHPLVNKAMNFFGIAPPNSTSTGAPTTQPAAVPTSQPTSRPAAVPTSQPTSRPAAVPTSQPASQSGLPGILRDILASFFSIRPFNPMADPGIIGKKLGPLLPPPRRGAPIASAYNPHLPGGGIPAMGGAMWAAFAADKGGAADGLRSWAQEMRERRDSLSAGLWSGAPRVESWFGNFQEEFPAPKPAPDDVPQFVDPNNFALRGDIRRKKRIELERLNRRVAGSWNKDLRGEAHAETYREIQRLRKSGREIHVGDRQRIYDEIYGKMREDDRQQQADLIYERDTKAAELGEWRGNRAQIERAEEKQRAYSQPPDGGTHIGVPSPKPVLADPKATGGASLEAIAARIENAVASIAAALGSADAKFATA